MKELGINAVWLSPCYKSPNEDNGYDISDYRDIMDEFGTLDDWKRMIAEMHKRGIKLIMDLVANHTSSEHKWFRESRKSKDIPYRDYYYWADKSLNDWKSVFGGSAWEYDKITDQYYLHSFAIGQPDLNWENPKVREEMKAVVDYWVDLGVDGFRCDVLDCISKDFKSWKVGNGPRFHEFVHELFGSEENRYESATMLAAMSYLQRGIPFIYQGQEIGSIDPHYDSIDDFDDIETVNYYKMNPEKLDESELIDRINFGNRDNSRRPMPWSDEKNGGFGGDPWLPVHNRYKDINVRSDMSADRSVYRFFKELIALRTNSEAFTDGSWENLTDGRDGIYIPQIY